MTKEKKRKKRNKTPQNHQAQSSLSCRRLLGRIGLASLRLYIQKAIIDLELEWTVLEWKGWGGEGRVAVERMRAGVEGVGGEKSRRLHCHTPSPLFLSLFFFFWSWLTPLLKIYFPPLPSTAVTKMAAIIFTKRILCKCSQITGTIRSIQMFALQRWNLR